MSDASPQPARTTGDDLQGRDPLRPESLADFTGQPDTVRHLGMMLTGAKRRGEMPDHILFSGPPGTGKTTLAMIIARELGIPLVTTSGPAIERPGEIAALLAGLTTPSVVFIDEIHRLPRTVEEILYSAMEDGVLDITVDVDGRTETLRIDLVPFVLVGATTQAGVISAPLRDRFGHHARLDLYDLADLTRIVERSAKLLNFPIEHDGAREVAGRSRGTPRIANRLLRRVRDWATAMDLTEPVTRKEAADALDDFGVDPLGLDKTGLELLRVLCTTYRGGPVGLSTLAAIVGESATTVSEVYEPFLLKQGLIGRTQRGRVATDAAYEHLGLTGGDSQGSLNLS